MSLKVAILKLQPYLPGANVSTDWPMSMPYGAINMDIIVQVMACHLFSAKPLPDVRRKFKLK